MRVPGRSEIPGGEEPSFVSRQVTQARRFYLNLTPTPGQSIQIVCGGVERCHPDYHIRRQQFPYMVLELVAEGYGTLNLNGKEFAIRPGTVFAYGHEIRHEIRGSATSPMLKYYVVFVGEEGEKLLQQGPLGQWEVVHLSSLTEVIDCLETMQQSGGSHTPYSQEICRHLMALLLLKISEMALPFDTTQLRAFATFKRVRAYLEQHFLDIKTVHDAAVACHVNLAYMCRLFQRYEHRSPYQYLMRLKMKKAAEHLLSSGKLVKEVSAELGFEDAYHFSRAFKKVYGLSPENFMKHLFHRVD